MTLSKRYRKLNDCLGHLRGILHNMGIVEFSASKKNHCICWSLMEDPDTELIEEFCDLIERFSQQRNKNQKATSGEVTNLKQSPNYANCRN